ARGTAAPAEPEEDEEDEEDDELADDLAAAGELDELDVDLEGDADEGDDEDEADEEGAPAAPAQGKGAPKAPPAKGAGSKAPAPPAGRGAGEAPDTGGGGLAGLLRALGATRPAPPKRPAGGMDLGDDDAAAPAAPPRKAPAAEEEAPAAPPPPKVQRTVPPMPPRKPGVITLAISPDADDAFMLFALEHGLVATEDRKYEIVRGEVARLNEEAQRGTYDVTAFSFGSWPQLVDRYLVLPSGGSLGDGVGPVVVSKTPVRSGEVSGLQVGVPGLTTTGALVLRMWLHPAKLNLVALPFEAVPVAVAAGKVRAGVLIHEAQLTYRSQGLVLVKDLGAWWTERTEGLPLPLGGMLVRRDISPEERAKINVDVKRSIAYAMGHRADALAHAARFAKGLGMALLERYIDNYVNELSLDMGERGRQAVHTLFQEAKRLGLVREVVELEMA
ncbi:MAG: menaquinone biosynthesis family protein, partial [Planctomycetia bacterium]